ncbi:TPA: DNA-directed RNA polymerase subunit H [Candidatus Micrarchaeota archaeon]|nr:DNA-directed RNA polymerase subunit H [Candidatus Micrarchaeota archaeon]
MSSAFTHYLMPKIEKMNDEELAELLKVLGCTKEQLPVVTLSDAGLNGLDVHIGDVVRITRDGKRKEFYYRTVVD